MSGLLDDPARAAAVAAARARIEPGMTIGLGSGRAVFALIELLAAGSSPRRLRAVAASSRTEARARAAGIDLVDLAGDRVLDLVPSAALRRTAGGLAVVTDEGHHLLDCTIPDGDLAALASALKAVLGVLGHGLFVDQADEVLLGHPDGTLRTLHR